MKNQRFKPGTDIHEVFAQLEFFCESRERRELRKGIQFLIKNFKQTPRVLNRCLDWYWRCGMIQEGLRLSAPSFEEISRRGRSDRVHTLGTERALFYLVFLANQSGIPWVRRWLEREEHLLSKTTKDRLLITNLWVASRDFVKSGESFKQYQKSLKEDPDSVPLGQSRMVHLTLAFIQYKSGQYGLAEKSCARALDLLDVTRSPLTVMDATTLKLLCRALQSGSAEKRQLRLIFSQFEEALSGFSDLIEKAPRLSVVFQTRKIVLLHLMGETGAARKLLREVDRRLVLNLPDYSPFRRVELLFEVACHAEITEAEWEILDSYPESPLHVGAGGVRRPAPRFIARPDPIQIASNLEPDHFRISILSQEYQIGKDSFHFGLPKEIELLSYLRRSHPFGIHRNLAMALLWPDQGTLILELMPRLAQLTQRLRKKHGFQVRVDRECLHLGERDSARVHVDRESTTPLSVEIMPPAPLSPMWIASTYKVGLTQAREILQKWVKNGWVETQGIGAHRRYYRQARS